MQQDAKIGSRYVVELLKFRKACRIIAEAKMEDVVNSINEKDFTALSNRLHDFAIRVDNETHSRQQAQARKAVNRAVAYQRWKGGDDVADFLEQFTKEASDE